MNGRTRVLVGVLGILVLGMVAGLVFMLKTGETRATQHPAQPSPDEPVTPIPPAPRESVTSVASRPATPAASDPARPVPVAPLDGNVHDHTSDPVPADPSPLVSTTVSAVRGALTMNVARCGEGLRKRNAPQVRMVVNAHLRVRNGRARVTNLTVDGVDGLTEDYKKCILRAYADLDTDVPDDQPDGAEDTVHMPWTAP